MGQNGPERNMPKYGEKAGRAAKSSRTRTNRFKSTIRTFGLTDKTDERYDGAIST